ncbi:hypothetical protein [Actinopolyspora halophila]|uniref:hypothetical protein n=1 Tax=Actinopolyspora halophila TaxID=1850 RepID=UPI00035CE169|nr:hypothetical protein [Actinopolyspora halophila]
MRVSLVVSSALLGVLSAFFAWAVHWAVSSYQEATYAIPGTVTTLTFGIGPRGDEAEDPAVVADELRDFVTERSLALVIASDGERAPQFIVADPEGVVPWYSPAHSNDGENQEEIQGAYVFEGTYSQRQWRRGESPALVPEGVEVVGAIPPPEGADDLQFVRPLGEYRLPPGEYVVNTDDPGELAELRGIVNRAGFGDHSAKSTPLGQYLTTDPLVGVTGGLLGAGFLAAVLFWTLGVRDRAAEFVIRVRHGATRARLVWQVWPRGLPFQVLGIVSGVALSSVLVALVGLQPLTRIEYLVLGAGATGGVVLAAAAWLLATALGTWTRDEVGRAG